MIRAGRSAVKLVEQGDTPLTPAHSAGARRPARGVKAGGAKSTPKSTPKSAAKVVLKRGTKPAKVGKGTMAGRPRDGRAAAKPQPIRVVKIKELNAQGKCGPGTSVVHLFRVDEVRDGAAAVHLVFFDRHGWYCEHGRSCPAVDDVRKLAGSHLARTN